MNNEDPQWHFHSDCTANWFWLSTRYTTSRYKVQQVWFNFGLCNNWCGCDSLQ